MFKIYKNSVITSILLFAAFLLGLLVVFIVNGVLMNYLFLTNTLLFFITSPLIIFLIPFEALICIIIIKRVILLFFKPQKSEIQKNSFSDLSFNNKMLWGINSLSNHIYYFTSMFFPATIKSLYYSLMGAKLERGVNINGILYQPERISIGEGTITGYGSIISGHVVQKNMLYVDKVVVGKNCLIGGYSIIMPGARIGDNVTIAAGAIVPKSTNIPENTIYFSTDKQKRN